MKILVTGGAGYIGSFMVNTLIDHGNEVTVIDNLERGHRWAINDKAEFIKGNILDSELMNSIFSKNKFDGVIHFAGLISMEESVKNPQLYFQNNVQGSTNLIECMLKHNINKIIFSSTAGVYGDPVKIPIPEDQMRRERQLMDQWEKIIILKPTLFLLR